ncbi:biotin--[acetyl-CoA-carboxylase] ligase [Thermococcus chitonophagus]|uniref:Biotin--[acetyl-CoA-carboxylase] ligase n=1 Tax=Thermococcus chitonophagus TaxID=54262 RepID=A0A170SAS4_9EURY|nr:biotin--[acetyl-CoA-carboxylase] ligase [Thermococcus chitonophagus]ASJ15737.1 biotin--[acetyl-CoA-carboxylase] ligase [Thermococcus chitonophagus]CUX76958.1 Biotin-protein ligase [Thermococcus chitonophagus]
MLGLKTSVIGKRVIYYQEISSTNDVAKSLDVEEGTVIIADRQARGRGRLNREWISPEGGLWLSVVLKPKVEPQDIPKIVFLGAIGVVRMLEELSIPGRIKWPNDVLVNFKKISGILTEKVGEKVILGIGVNVNNDAPENGIAVKDVLNRKVDLVEAFKTLLENLDELYEIYLESPETIVELARELMILNVPVKVIGDGEITGVAEGIDEDGRLILRLDSGEVRKILYGDVSLRFL